MTAGQLAALFDSHRVMGKYTNKRTVKVRTVYEIDEAKQVLTDHGITGVVKEAVQERGGGLHPLVWTDVIVAR